MIKLKNLFLRFDFGNFAIKFVEYFFSYRNLQIAFVVFPDMFLFLCEQQVKQLASKADHAAHSSKSAGKLNILLRYTGRKT